MKMETLNIMVLGIITKKKDMENYMEEKKILFMKEHGTKVNMMEMGFYIIACILKI